MLARLYNPIADEIAEPRPDMNIKVTALTVSKKCHYTHRISIKPLFEDTCVHYSAQLSSGSGELMFGLGHHQPLRAEKALSGLYSNADICQHCLK